MYEYLHNLNEASTEIVINTEGRICCMADSDTLRNEIIHRHYAFLVDYMGISPASILYVSLDNTNIKDVNKRVKHYLPGAVNAVVAIENIDIDKLSQYKYILIRDGHNVDIFTKNALSNICRNADNILFAVNGSRINKNPNFDLADFLMEFTFDYEINSGYSVSQYLHRVEEWKEIHRKELEDAERRRKKREEAEAKRKAEAEEKARIAAQEKARKEAEARRVAEEAEKKTKEEAERKTRKEAERIAREKAEAEEKSRAEEEERKRNTPYFQKLARYIYWYRNNWQFMVSSGSYRWEAIECFTSHFDLQARNLSSNLESAFAKSSQLMTGVLLRSQKMLIKCASICPDETRILLRNLFNEKDSFQMRMLLFRSMTERIASEMRNRSSITNEEISHLNNIRAAATYIALAYPDKHYQYRLFPFQQFCSKVGIKAPSVSDFESEYEHFELICNQIRETLLADKELLEIHDKTYPNDKSNYHLLTYDFIYAIGYHMIDLSKAPKQ